MNADQTHKPKILMIDDDPFIADMYVLKFRDEQFEIETARNGKDGLKKITEFNPDVILLDIVMPDMDGFQVLEELKKKSIPRKIILLTNLGQKEDVERGLALGASDYIVKAHFTPSEVVERVRKLLGAR
ncbi:MAG: response regulator [Candidatus Sungbacteria bacterium]|nr:response regulator [Candidatus Sungbacteria bacterium]